jgi:glycosyltransferase involved in cell wall biosynthesis
MARDSSGLAEYAVGLAQSRVKVCIISPGPPSDSGGVESSVRRLTSYLTDWGFDWLALCGAGSGTGSASRKVKVCTGVSGPLLSRLTLGWKAAWRAVRDDVDVIHVHGAEYGWALAVALGAQRWRMHHRGAARIPSPPIIVTCHGALRSSLYIAATRSRGRNRLLATVAQPVFSLLESRVLRHATSIACVSSRVASELRRWYPSAQNAITIIPNAVDDIMFAAKQSEKTATSANLLWVGGDTLEKDLGSALAVFAHIKEACPQASLTIAGVSGQARRDGISFAGRLRPEAMASLYRRSSLLISTSLYEGDPLCVKEAMASGTPVLATPAAAGVVQDGINGVVSWAPLSTHEGQQEFANKAKVILSDPRLWGQLSRGATATASEFTGEKEERGYRQIYRQLLGLRHE